MPKGMVTTTEIVQTDYETNLCDCGNESAVILDTFYMGTSGSPATKMMVKSCNECGKVFVDSRTMEYLLDQLPLNKRVKKEKQEEQKEKVVAGDVEYF